MLLRRVPDLRKLYVEPSTACNLSCRTCIHNTWDDPGAHMEWPVFEAFIGQCRELPDLKRLILGGLGEPLCHPRLFEMIGAATREHLSLTMTTNALLLERHASRELIRLGLDRLVVSLDGTRAETYGEIRGTAMAPVLDNLRIFNEEKSKAGALSPFLEIEFVALKSNIAELPALAALAGELGATTVLVSNVLAYTEDMREEVLYGYEPRRPFASGSWPVKAGAWVMWGTMNLPRMHWGADRRCRFVQDKAAFVGWDGTVSPCYALAHNYRYHAVDGRQKRVSRYSLGKVQLKSLSEIWQSEEYCRFRAEVLDFRFPSCPDCDLREGCDLRENNRGCWGWDPSCADCLWAQDIVRCPGAGR
jgi:tungsten cofactor oxidoreducase radical SAM maturase